MAKKKDFNQSKNFLYFLGRPVYYGFLWLFLSLVYITTFLSHFISHLKFSFSLPHFTFPKISLPRFSLFTFHFPRISLRRPRFHHLYPRPQPKALPLINTRSLRIILFLTLSFSSLFAFVYLEFFYDLPDPRSLDNFPSKLTTQILDRNGQLLYKIYEDENRTLVTLDSLPPHVKNAFLAAEDKDFYHHKGFSISGVFRALYKNIFNNKTEGGSTITQQLVKNTLLTNEKTLTRKIKELILAVEIEFTYSKDEIFQMYLNQVGFGGTAYGIQEASMQYFNVNAKDLSLAQASFLAGLPQAPSKYSPYGDQPELAKTRQQFVLDQMLNDGFISPSEHQKALAQKLVFNSAQIKIKAPHFVMYVKNLLIEQLGENVVNQGGLIVTTTLDLDLQEKVQGIVTSEVQMLQNYHVTNGAALVTNPHTGEVLAMVGSKDYFNLNEDGQVNLTLALRQPGSSIKPLNYALAFENGYGPGSVVEDKPLSFNLPGQEPWTPKNYDGKFHGYITLRTALGSSYNIPSVVLLSKNGISNFVNLAQKMGITSWNDPSRYGLSMALGSLEVRMFDMATAYSTFANSGVTTPLTSILKVEKANGEKIFVSGCSDPNLVANTCSSVVAVAQNSNCSSHQTISPTTAYLITDVLSDNSARTPAFGSNSILNIKSSKVAVKTGTSNDLRDNWTFGYTKDYLVSTWVGNNDNSPMSHIASGITGASPIWARIFNTILADNPQTATASAAPQDLVKIGICSLTGTLPCAGCPIKYEYFVKGTEPQTACDPNRVKEILNPTPVTTPLAPQIL